MPIDNDPIKKVKKTFWPAKSDWEYLREVGKIEQTTKPVTFGNIVRFYIEKKGYGMIKNWIKELDGTLRSG